MKQVPPNGCLFCETPQPSHGSRGDGLHPRGVWTWVEPSDKVRLQRMKRNRQIRKGFTMNDDVFVGAKLTVLPTDKWVGTWVTYHGNTRENLYGNGQLFKVVERNFSNTAVGFDDGKSTVVWCAPGALRIAEARYSSELDQLFSRPETAVDTALSPYSSAVAAIDADIKIAEQRIEKLKAAKQALLGL